MSRAGRRFGLFLALAVVVVLGAMLVLRRQSTRRLERAIARFEAEAGSLDLSTYAPPPVERRENAALWLRAGAGALILDTPQNVLIERRVRALGEPWTPADAESFAALLADHEPARRLIDRAASLERSSFEIEYRRGAEAEIPDFLSLLRAARLLAVECDFRQQRGESEPALAALHLLERLTAAQRAETVLIALLAGSATERLYLDRLEAMLQLVADPDAVRALRRDLEHLDSSTVPPQRSFAADTAAVIPWILRNPGEWPSEISPAAGRSAPGPLRPYIALIGLDRKAAALVLEMGLQTVESVTIPSARWDAGEQTRARKAPDRLVPSAATIARALAPNYRHAIQRLQWIQSARALGRLAVDLRLSRLGHGVYPSQPADLPLSAATGETAVYRILDDGTVEVAFPAAEANWEIEEARADQTGKIGTADYNLRWRLPP
jgi:hypothetical protein